MRCSTPWDEASRAAGSSASPTTTCAPRTLNAAAFIGSRTSTLSWCPASISLWATPRPKKPVEPSKRILATVEILTEGILETSVRAGGGGIRSGPSGLSDRRGRHRGGAADPAPAGAVSGNLWIQRGDHLHQHPGRVRGHAPAGRRRPDGAVDHLPQVTFAPGISPFPTGGEGGLARSARPDGGELLRLAAT